MVQQRRDFGLEQDITTTLKLLEALPSRYRSRAVRPSMTAGARIARNAVRAASPVKTGELKRKIKSTTYRPRQGRFPAAGVVIDVPYAVVVEYGRKAFAPFAAREFVRNSMLGAASDVARAIRQTLTERSLRMARQLISEFPTGQRGAR